MPSGLGNQPIGYFKTNHGGTSGLTSFARSDREVYQTLELRATFYPVRWMSLMLVMPFQFAMEKSGSKLDQKVSQGDMMLMATFYPFWTQKERFSHRLGLISGIKAPTGSYPTKDNQEIVNTTIYGGSGSWDFILGGLYVFRYRKFGANSTFTAKLNTANPNGYRTDHTISVQQTVFGSFVVEPQRNPNRPPLTLVPSTGIFLEANQGDYRKGDYYVVGTGGQRLFWQAGLECYVKQFGVYATLRIPVWQNLYGTQLAAGGRFIVGINYSFQFKKPKRKEGKA